MKLGTILLCVTAMATGLLLAGSPAAAAGAAVKVPLIHNPLNNCQLGADAIPGSGTATDSFTVVVGVPQGVQAIVVLRGGHADATYNVFLIQSMGLASGDPLDCLVQDATLRTNHAGTGTAVIRESILPGAAYVHAYLYTFDGGFDQFDTRLIPLG